MSLLYGFILVSWVDGSLKRNVQRAGPVM